MKIGDIENLINERDDLKREVERLKTGITKLAAEGRKMRQSNSASAGRCAEWFAEELEKL